MRCSSGFRRIEWTTRVLDTSKPLDHALYRYLSSRSRMMKVRVMAFLAPLFFVGLAALAIPVLIHLTQREKKMVQQFPSLMFVRRIPYQSVRRRKIRDLALLMVRLAALALIIAAFARPFLWRPDAATAIGPGAREVVVLLDQSYSMGYGDRWDRAKAAARDAINALGAADRGSVVLFSSGADITMRSTGERDRLVASFEAATPTPSATRYGPALKVAGSILAESPLPRREVILISDFQRNGWRGEEGSRLPAGSTVTPVMIGGPTDAPDAAVTSVALARSTFSEQERVTLTAAVANRSDKPVVNDTITLEIAGRGVQTEPLNIDANGSASIAFAPFTVTSRNMRVSVRAGMDALAVRQYLRCGGITGRSGAYRRGGRRDESRLRAVPGPRTLHR